MLAAGLPGGQVKQPVAQQLRGCVAQFTGGLGQVPEAGEQGSVQGHDPCPCHVDRPVLRWPQVQADGLGLFDVVLDVNVRAVPGVQPGDLVWALVAISW